MKAILAIPAMLIAINAAAECPAHRPGAAPAVPEGASASRAEMYEAQEAVKAYIDQLKEYLECNERMLSNFEHDYYAHRAHDAALVYNEQLKAHRQSQEAIAVN